MLEFFLPSFCETEIVYINNYKILSIKKFSISNYLIIPNPLKITKTNNLLMLAGESQLLSNFSFKMKSFLKYIATGAKKQLFLKGLGLRASGTVSKNTSLIKFKLGYSHDCTFLYKSNTLRTQIRRTHLFLEGINPVNLGNIAQKIARLRTPDSYKGRGILLYGRRYKIKQVKKKK